jgi:hypothetical protein
MAMSVAAPPVVALGSCPAHVRQLRAADLPAAERAVVAAFPALAGHVDEVRRVRPQGDVLPARPCSAVRRSVLVHAYLPSQRATPSLTGNPVYYVARTRAHWVIWFQAH